jgi:hypothetical protein
MRDIPASNALQNRLTGLDRRAYAAVVGLSIGVIGGLLGLMLALAGPVVTYGAVFGTLAGLYVLTDVRVALYGLVATVLILPFGTFPFEIAFTPTLIDLAMGAFLLVYLFQWMTGRRYTLQLTPVHALIGVYMLWLLLSFALGLRHSPITMNVLRQFVETLLSLGMVFVVVDLMRDGQALRRLVLVVLAVIGAQALITLVLYGLPDTAAEAFLIRLSRIGYPDGGVIRYIESNPELPERAIGTWVDPNALGGVLAIAGVLIAPQIVAKRPVLRYRWLTLVVFALVMLALFLTYSRASLLAFGIGLVAIAFVRYRFLIPVLVLGVALFLTLPQTQPYVERIVEAFSGADLATQMRIGEYTDSLRLIQRYPIFGVGFTGTPEIDIYTDVASMYLIMANQIGLVGLSVFIITIGGVFVYGAFAWRHAKHDVLLDSIQLGFHAALLTALANATADLYFFRIDFQGSITLFWIIVALALASSRLALEHSMGEPT